MANNYAFIDSQNIYLGVKNRGWTLDWKRFRVHLKETYGVSVAYTFIGLIPEYERIYTNLQRWDTW